MKLYPVQLTFTCQSSIIAQRTLPDAISSRQSETAPPEEMDRLVTRVIEAIEAEEIELDIQPLDLALLVGKAFLNENIKEGKIYDIVIPIQKPEGKIIRRGGMSTSGDEDLVIGKGLFAPSEQAVRVKPIRFKGPVDPMLDPPYEKHRG